MKRYIMFRGAFGALGYKMLKNDESKQKQVDIENTTNQILSNLYLV